MTLKEDAPAIRARVKLNIKDDIPAEILSYTGLVDNKEHIAIVFNSADKQQKSPLVRVHSECLTGDLFHSSRCDCGEQLDESINIMKDKGGIILYLRQEGRGIGLYNKLDAYLFQEKGIDTYEANRKLGFNDDERNYDDAINMLKAMKVSSIHLLTNNPLKIDAIGKEIFVESIQNTKTYLKRDNKNYLLAKYELSDHQLETSLI
ncbi:MAG TPA: GTP cyclohydrolase [Colwellia sp.]|jgi:GTP cyclohydrolase II|nr:GTP cyclohydrolase [Colwellia sp.]|tara:strand:+ start:2176 stop:2790 length:615 start_codon:yes stop_codon:yes gene_type:complete